MKLFKFLVAFLLLTLSVSSVFAYRHVSPYAYCAGNPINNIDIDGKQIVVGIPNIPILSTADPILLGRTPIMANADKVVNLGKSFTKAPKNGVENSAKAATRNATKTETENTSGSESLSENYTDSGIGKSTYNINNKALNQARQMVKKGNCPKEIERIDKPDPNIPGSQWHAHGSKGAINQNGTYKDGNPGFVKNTIKWLNRHGFNISEDIF